jgi:hypothetical protein
LKIKLLRPVLLLSGKIEHSLASDGTDVIRREPRKPCRLLAAVGGPFACRPGYRISGHQTLAYIGAAEGDPSSC